MSTAEGDASKVESRILSQLLLLQGSLHIFLSFDRLAGFVQQGLADLPGARRVRLVAPQPPSPIRPVAPTANPTVVSLPLETPRAWYGSIEILPHDEQLLRPYLPHLRNVANVIAVHLERQAHERALRELNESLRREIERKNLAERRLEDAQRKLQEMIERDLVAAASAGDTNGEDTSRAAIVAGDSSRAAEAASAAASLGTALMVPVGLDEITSVVLEHLKRLTDSPDGRVAALGRQGGEVVELARAETRPSSRAPGSEESERGDFDLFWREVLLSGKAAYVNNAMRDEGYPSTSANSPEVRRFLAVPVRWGGKVVGQIAAADAPRPYGDDDVALVDRLGDLYALAIRRHQELEEQRQHHRQIQTSQRLEALGVLASGIAHEFRNLLQIIQGSAEVILENAKVRHGPAAESEEILRAASRGASLTNQLLAFARRAEPRLAILDLNTIVRRVATMLERTLPRSIQIDLRLQEQAGAIQGDSGQLEQVLLNLALNAKDAMPDGGQLRIESYADVPSSPAAAETADQNLGPVSVLRVSDTGVGVDPEHLDRIFEPFFTTKDPGRGTGLGLSVAYGVVSRHGGRLTCSSRPGEGTTFEVTLPRIESTTPEKEDRSRSDAPPPSSRGETILVVDDEPAIRGLARRGLSLFGYEVIEAASGEEALEIYQREDSLVDLVILDLGMQGMGGRACLVELRRLDPEAKVLVASGYALGQEEAELIAEGACGVLSKPFGFQKLAERIRSTLEEPRPE